MELPVNVSQWQTCHLGFISKGTNIFFVTIETCKLSTLWNGSLRYHLVPTHPLVISSWEGGGVVKEGGVRKWTCLNTSGAGLSHITPSLQKQTDRHTGHVPHPSVVLLFIGRVIISREPCTCRRVRFSARFQGRTTTRVDTEKERASHSKKRMHSSRMHTARR